MGSGAADFELKNLSTLHFPKLPFREKKCIFEASYPQESYRIITRTRPCWCLSARAYCCREIYTKIEHFFFHLLQSGQTRSRALISISCFSSVLWIPAPCKRIRAWSCSVLLNELLIQRLTQYLIENLKLLLQHSFGHLKLYERLTQ